VRNSTYMIRRHDDLLKTAVLSALLSLGAGMTSAQAADESVANASGPRAGVHDGNPYAIQSSHHGVIPTVDRLKLMREWAAAHPPLDFSASHVTADAVAPWSGFGDPTLVYQGGQNGIDGQNNVGVMSGPVKVYLVFYGSQWGNQTTDTNSNDKFSGDPSAVASAAQQMFKGIGTNNETWQADLTQWCDGVNVANGVTACPANANFIPYQKNILAGVWYDNSAASPASATAAQIANVAVAAAAHFGNTTAASNRYAYYIIMSPHGTNPDNYQGNYCAYHDSTSAAGVNSPYGEIAYSNQPYNTDSGAGCGVGFVNNPGTTDGYTMTLGHEWHEMMSDTFFPANGSVAGWYSTKWGAQVAGQGGENSDECAWIGPGQAGGAQNVAFSTGSFAEQASWSNDTQSCAISHAILAHGGGTPTASFSYTTSGLTVNFTDTSTDAGGSITSRSWNFGDNGTSTTTNPSHTYAAAGTYSVTETVTDSASGKTSSKTSAITVTASTAAQNIIAASSSLCLNVANNSSGTGVIQSPCAATGNEEWTLVPVGSYYHIVAKGSGLCLNVPNSTSTTGTQLIQYGCQGSGTTNDQWSLVAVGGRYHIVSRVNSLCVNIAGNSGSSGAKVIQWTCQSASVLNDQFTFH